MYEWFSALVSSISGFLYTYLLIILLLAVGLYFTVRRKLVQFGMLKESIKLVTSLSGYSFDGRH